MYTTEQPTDEDRRRAQAEISREATAHRERLRVLGEVAVQLADWEAGQAMSTGELAAALGGDACLVLWAVDTLEDLDLIRYTGFDDQRACGFAPEPFGYLYDVWSVELESKADQAWCRPW